MFLHPSCIETVCISIRRMIKKSSFFQTDAIREASQRCKDVQDQLDRKNKEVSELLLLLEIQFGTWCDVQKRSCR